MPEASLEEQEQEEEEEEEMPLKPQFIPQGSGGSGVLMGPNTQKGLKKHTPLGLHTHKHRVTWYPKSVAFPWAYAVKAVSPNAKPKTNEY